MRMIVVSATEGTTEATSTSTSTWYLIAAYRQTSPLTNFDLAWPTILRTLNFQSS